MKPISILFLIFLLVPLAEIYLLIEIGSVIGAGWTIAGVVATALLGAWLVKIQGLITAFRARDSLQRGVVPGLELIEGLFLLVAGALLITPGFVTDAIGFMCLTPSIRRPLARAILARIKVAVTVRQGQTGDSGKSKFTYEGDYREIKK